MAFTFLYWLRFEVYCSGCFVQWFGFHIFPSKMSANKSNYRLWVAYFMGPSCIIFSQYGLFHWDMQKSLELIAVVQTRRTIFWGKEKKKTKRDRQAKLPKEILNPWQTLLAPTWSGWKLCTLVPPLKANSSGKKRKKEQNVFLPTHAFLHNRLFTLHRLSMGVLPHAGLSQFCPEAKQVMKDTVPLPFPRSNLLFILQPVY